MVSVDELLRQRLRELASQVTMEPTDGLLFLTGAVCIAISAVSFLSKRTKQRRGAKAPSAAPSPSNSEQPSEVADDSFPQV